jgi:hypothetical protein
VLARPFSTCTFILQVFTAVERARRYHPSIWQGFL